MLQKDGGEERELVLDQAVIIETSPAPHFYHRDRHVILIKPAQAHRQENALWAKVVMFGKGGYEAVNLWMQVIQDAQEIRFGHHHPVDAETLAVVE